MAQSSSTDLPVFLYIMQMVHGTVQAVDRLMLAPAPRSRARSAAWSSCDLGRLTGPPDATTRPPAEPRDASAPTGSPGPILVFVMIFGLIAFLSREKKTSWQRTAGLRRAAHRRAAIGRLHPRRPHLRRPPAATPIDGRAVLDFVVKKPIDKHPVRPRPRASDQRHHRQRPGARQDNMEQPRRARHRRPARTLQPRRRRSTLGVDYGGRPHVAKKRAVGRRLRLVAHASDGQPWVASAVEGEGCDLFWPCFDNSLVEVGTGRPAHHRAQGPGRAVNGRAARHRPDRGRPRTLDTGAPSTRTTTRSRSTSRPYQVAHGDYHSRFGNTIPLDYWYLPGEDATGARRCSPSSRRRSTSSKRMIGPYPFGDEKMGVVETPHLGMEHQTINAYGNDYKTGARRLRLAAAARVQPRMVRQPADQRRLGRHVAARGLRHATCSRSTASGCTATWRYDADLMEAARA